MKDLDEMRNVNRLLATTYSGEIYDELIIARKQIGHLEKNAKVFTPNASNEQANERKNKNIHYTPMIPMKSLNFPIPSPIHRITCRLSPISLANHSQWRLKKSPWSQRKSQSILPNLLAII
ncbi:hypothetical protein PENTCL1PPCAC_8220, partial [Pristionchus entomophagus]